MSLYLYQPWREEPVTARAVTLSVRTPHKGGKTVGRGSGEEPPSKLQGGPGTHRFPGGHSRCPQLAPGLTPHCTSRLMSFKLTSEVQPEGRGLASSIIASIISEWFLVCYLHCSLGEKTSLPAEVLQCLLFIQDYTSNPIIKHRSCPESRVIAYRCAQTQTSAHPPWPPA